MTGGFGVVRPPYFPSHGAAGRCKQSTKAPPWSSWFSFHEDEDEDEDKMYVMVFMFFHGFPFTIAGRR